MRLVGLVGIGLALASPALAQDWQASPNYGQAILETGFMPDPHFVDLVAGGTINVRDTLGGECRGYVTSAPDYDLYYAAGDEYPLVISAASASDVTLVIHAPDGTWHCDDDGGNGLNASIVFDNPESGLYDIWVGSYGDHDFPARLGISEARSF